MTRAPYFTLVAPTALVTGTVPLGAEIIHIATCGLSAESIVSTPKPDRTFTRRFT